MKINTTILHSDYNITVSGSTTLSSSKQLILKQLLADPLLQQVRHKHCPICSHDQARLIAQIDRDSIPLDTVICDACGLIFSLSIYTPEAMSHFYSTYYRTLFDNKTNDEGSINDSCIAITN